MENKNDLVSTIKVLENQELVESILSRLGYSLSMLWSRLFSPTFSKTTRSTSFGKNFTDNSTQANVGYIVEFDGRYMRKNKFMYDVADQGHETADFIRSKVNQELLLKQEVLALEDGVVLTPGAAGGVDGYSYYTSCIFSSSRRYTRICKRIPKIQVNQQCTVNTLGQFGVLPNAGYRESTMSFFQSGSYHNCISTHEGVRFSSLQKKFFVYASVYDGVDWIGHVSETIISARFPLFQKSPYCILDGDDLYMMYLVNYLVMLDIATGNFDSLALPSTIGQKPHASCYDYRVGPRSCRGLVLVNYHEGGILKKWVLKDRNMLEPWQDIESVNLMEVFDPIIPYATWEAVLDREKSPTAFDNKYTVKVMNVTKDAKLVFITFGFHPGMFELNMETLAVSEMNSSSRVSSVISKIYHVAEPWPPNQ